MVQGSERVATPSPGLAAPRPLMLLAWRIGLRFTVVRTGGDMTTRYVAFGEHDAGL